MPQSPTWGEVEAKLKGAIRDAVDAVLAEDHMLDAVVVHVKNDDDALLVRLEPIYRVLTYRD